MRTLVFDASPLVALLRNKPSAEAVERLLNRANERGEALFISCINWGEIYSSVCKIHGPGVAAEKLHVFSKSIVVVPVGVDDAVQAADLKVRFLLPYADAFAAVLAIKKNAQLVVADRDFERVKSLVSLLRVI